MATLMSTQINGDLFVTGTITSSMTNSDRVFNAKTLGIVGDGITDDRASIQSAINLISTYTSGGVLYLPPGKYHVTNGLDMKNNVYLVGSHTSATHISCSYDPTSFSNAVSYLFNFNNTASGSGVYNIKATAFSWFKASGSSVVDIKNAHLYSSLGVSGVTYYGYGGYHIGGMTTASITNTVIENAGRGIDLFPSNSCTITDSASVSYNKCTLLHHNRLLLLSQSYVTMDIDKWTDFTNNVYPTLQLGVTNPYLGANTGSVSVKKSSITSDWYTFNNIHSPKCTVTIRDGSYMHTMVANGKSILRVNNSMLVDTNLERTSSFGTVGAGCNVSGLDESTVYVNNTSLSRFTHYYGTGVFYFNDSISLYDRDAKCIYSSSIYDESTWPQYIGGTHNYEPSETYNSAMMPNMIMDNSSIVFMGDDVLNSLSDVEWCKQVEANNSFTSSTTTYPSSASIHSSSQWASSTSYVIGDYRYISSRVWVCVKNHTSTANVDTDILNGNWRLLVGTYRRTDGYLQAMYFHTSSGWVPTVKQGKWHGGRFRNRGNPVALYQTNLYMRNCSIIRHSATWNWGKNMAGSLDSMAANLGRPTYPYILNTGFTNSVILDNVQLINIGSNDDLYTDVVGMNISFDSHYDNVKIKFNNVLITGEQVDMPLYTSIANDSNNLLIKNHRVEINNLTVGEKSSKTISNAYNVNNQGIYYFVMPSGTPSWWKSTNEFISRIFPGFLVKDNRSMTVKEMLVNHNLKISNMHQPNNSLSGETRGWVGNIEADGVIQGRRIEGGAYIDRVGTGGGSPTAYDRFPIKLGLSAPNLLYWETGSIIINSGSEWVTGSSTEFQRITLNNQDNNIYANINNIEYFLPIRSGVASSNTSVALLATSSINYTGSFYIGIPKNATRNDSFNFRRTLTAIHTGSTMTLTSGSTVISASAHGMTSGYTFTSDAGVYGFTNYRRYRVNVLDADTFQIKPNSGSLSSATAVTITGTSGAQTFRAHPTIKLVFYTSKTLTYSPMYGEFLISFYGTGNTDRNNYKIELFKTQYSSPTGSSYAIPNWYLNRQLLSTGAHYAYEMNTDDLYVDEDYITDNNKFVVRIHPPYHFIQGNMQFSVVGLQSYNIERVYVTYNSL